MLYEKYFQSVSNLQIDHLKMEIKKCVDRVISNTDKIDNHHFTQTAPLDLWAAALWKELILGLKVVYLAQRVQ